MKKYVLMTNNVVDEVFNEFVDEFPGIHIKDRYAAELIESCMIIDENVEVGKGYIYNSLEDKFDKPMTLLYSIIENYNFEEYTLEETKNLIMLNEFTDKVNVVKNVDTEHIRFVLNDYVLQTGEIFVDESTFFQI